MIDGIGMAKMTEKRVAARHRVLKQGTLAFGGGGVDCVVRNLSSSGARLDVVNPIGLPQSFTLVIPADRFIHRCHLVWSHDKRIGVAFD
jgi:PilZ domain-containing protein